MNAAHSISVPRSVCPGTRFIALLFFFSGASSLIIETVFNRLLTYTFGSTAAAVSTVLAAFLGGLALGAWLLGKWVDGRRASLRAYGWLEGIVAAYALCITHIFSLLTVLYVHFCRHFALTPTELTLARFAMASIAVLPASFLMGGTLPVLSRYVAGIDSDFRQYIDRLYAWNTVGAAVGALVSTYALIPALGILGAIYVSCSINALILISCVALSPASSSAIAAPESLAESPDSTPPVSRPRRTFLLAGSFLTGAAALGYEVIWTHIQAFTIGNSVYAFGVTLFVVLCGLGIGAHLATSRFRKPSSWAIGLIASQFLLGAVIFFTLPLWGRLSDFIGGGYVRMMRADAFAILTPVFLLSAYLYLKSSRRSATDRGASDVQRQVFLLAAGIAGVLLALALKYGARIALTLINGGHATALFAASEIMRFVCAFSMLIIPAILLGLSFPLLLNLCTHSAEKAGSSVGSVYAANTFGAILGAVLTGFFLIPTIGSQGTLRSLASVNVLLAFAFALVLVPARSWARPALATAGAALAALGWFAVANWNPKLVCNGAYVYFRPAWVANRVLYQREDAAGGMTSVVQSGSIRTMLSNGKFQGDDSTEEAAQVRFAMIPMLFAHHWQNGLVIGLGTGQTLRTLTQFPLRTIDVAEMAPQIVDAARKWFTDVNGDVMDTDPRIHLSIADGRNFLLLSRRRYDVISIEVSSIWIDGEADLYNREFYELCSEHLSQDGVLMQWVQLHNMPRKNLLVILNTAARVFPHAAFFVDYGSSGQGVLIASRSPLTIDYNWLRALDADSSLRPALASLHVPAAESLLGDLVLYDGSFRDAVATLPKISRLPADFVSSDFRPYLEYATPMGNVDPRNTLKDNLEWLQTLRPATLPPQLVVRGIPSKSERNLLLGYVLAERQQTQLALEYLNSVTGPSQRLAQQEIAQLQHPSPASSR